MDCTTFKAYLGPWLDDNRVDGRIRASLEAHSMLCSDCRRLVRTREALRVIVGSSPVPLRSITDRN